MSKFLIPVSWDSNLRLNFDDLTILLMAAIHFELSKLVQRQAGDRPIGEVRTKAMQLLGENVRPFLIPPAKKPPGVSWKLLLGALVVALGSLVTSIVLTARN
ncbi:unnamed protein product [Boreogadus saida]